MQFPHLALINVYYILSYYTHLFNGLLSVCWVQWRDGQDVGSRRNEWRQLTLDHAGLFFLNDWFNNMPVIKTPYFVVCLGHISTNQTKFWLASLHLCVMSWSVIKQLIVWNALEWHWSIASASTNISSPEGEGILYVAFLPCHAITHCIV